MLIETSENDTIESIIKEYEGNKMNSKKYDSYIHEVSGY